MFDGLPPSARPRHPSRLVLDDADPINRGLLGWWPLDEGGGSFVGDISPWRGHGDVVGTAPRGVGATGRAIVLDGSTQCVAGRSVRQSLTAFSASAWVFCTGGTNMAILSGIGSGQEILWQINDTGYGQNFWATTTLNPAASTAPGNLSNTWIHLGVTWRSGRATQFYLNGATNGSGTTAGDIVSTVTGWTLGRWTLSRHFPGRLRGVRVWRRVLSDRDFRRLCADPNAGAISPEERIFQAYRRAAPPLTSTITGGTLALTANLAAAWAPDTATIDAGTLALTANATAEWDAATTSAGPSRRTRRGARRIYLPSPASAVFHPNALPAALAPAATPAWQDEDGEWMILA